MYLVVAYLQIKLYNYSILIKGVFKMTIGERIKQRRKELGLSVDEVADRLGKNRATVYRYESNDIENFPVGTLEPIAKILETTPAKLMGWNSNDDLPNGKSESISRPRGVKIPVLGDVAAGIPIEAIEDIIDYEEIDENLARRGDFFGLRIKGNSMSPRIQSGDVVIVRVQSDAENGDIVIAKVNGDDACCKKLLKHNDGITLLSFNQDYEPLSFNKQDIASLPVSIIGKVVELRGKF